MTEFRALSKPIVPPEGMELHRSDMTATFGSEVTLAAAQSGLAEFGQWIPIDGAPHALMGDQVCFNSTGPLRLGYGAWRDLLLGVQFENGRGELISAGGQTVKNVAGYDLTKFMVGSAGLFGRVVAITVRTYKIPDGALLAIYPPDPRILSRLLPTPLRPQWSIITAQSLFCGYLGNCVTLEYYRSTLAQSDPAGVTEHTITEDIARRALLWTARGEIHFRASVPPARILEFAEKLGDVSWVGDPAFGIVLGSQISEVQIPIIKVRAQQVGGSVQFLRRTGTDQKWTLHPASCSFTMGTERRIIERLKYAFDPDGNLNPLLRPTL